MKSDTKTVIAYPSAEPEEQTWPPQQEPGIRYIKVVHNRALVE